MKEKLRKQAKKETKHGKVNKKYTNEDSGQATRMAKEVKKFKGTSGGEAYHLWSGDSPGGKKKGSYKTKTSKHTNNFKKKFG